MERLRGLSVFEIDILLQIDVVLLPSLGVILKLWRGSDKLVSDLNRQKSATEYTHHLQQYRYKPPHPSYTKGGNKLPSCPFPTGILLFP